MKLSYTRSALSWHLLFLGVLSILSLNTRSLAQNGTVTDVTGSVIDAETNRPMSGVSVSIEDGGKIIGDVTDGEGRFSIGNVSPGRKKLRARYIGYATEIRDIEVRAGAPLRIDLTLTPDPIRKSPIDVIGESPTVHRRLAGAATIVPPRTIRLTAPIGTQELLQRIPGIHGFADDGIGNSRISIGIRGLNPRRSSHVLILEDGVPIQPALYIYPNMYYNPPTERIERVEVIKGSGAIQYGPQTMGGVINYLTRRPRQNFGGAVQLNGGTHGLFSALAEIGGWGTERVQPELQLLYKRGDGYRENNSFTQYNATLKVNILPDDDKIIYIKANANYEQSNATYTGLTEYSFATDPTFNPKEDDLFTVWRASLDAIYTNTITENLIGNTKLYANVFDRQWWREDDVFVRASQYDPNGEIDPVPYFEVGNLIRVGGGRTNHGNLRHFTVLGAEQTYDLKHDLFGAEGSVQLGGRLHWDRFKDDKKAGSSPDARDGIYYRIDPNDTANIEILGQSLHYETMALALHVMERLRIGALTITPGLRFEIFEQEQIDRLQGSRYADKTSHVLLPGLGLNYEIGSFNIFGGIHRGYTPPSDGTLRLANFGAGTDNHALDLESEKSWNKELGVRGSLPWLGFELTGFHLAIEDLIAPTRGAIFENLGRVVTYGTELDATLRTSAFSSLLPDFTLAYTYLETEVIEGKMKSAVIAGDATVDIAGRRLPYAPRHAVTAGIEKSFDFGLTLRGEAQYTSKVYTDLENIETTGNRGDKGPIPSYTIVNASALYTIDDRWRAGVVAKNIADEIYIGSRLHSSPAQPEANQSSGIIPGPRRQINVTVAYTFGD